MAVDASTKTPLDTVAMERRGSSQRSIQTMTLLASVLSVLWTSEKSLGLLSPLCRTSTSNAAEAELSKSSRTQITLETVSSLCCHLVSASAAWWQKLRDSGGVSSPRPSDSWTQTQPLNIIMTSLINHSQSFSHSLLSTSYWQCHLHTALSVFWYLIFLIYFFWNCCYMSTMYNLFAHSSLVQSCFS